MWNAERAEMYADQAGDDAPCGRCEGGKHCGQCLCCAPDDPRTSATINSACYCLECDDGAEIVCPCKVKIAELEERLEGAQHTLSAYEAGGVRDMSAFTAALKENRQGGRA